MSTARQPLTFVLGIAVSPILLLAAVVAAPGQTPGSLDLSFNANVVADSGGFVRAAAVQPDGKIIIAGDFRSVRGVERNNIARVHADGTLDMTFNPNANGFVQCVALQADGKVLLGGFFFALQPNGAPSATTRNYIARVNADGSLDTGFDPNANNPINSIAVQPDGKLLIGGGFTSLKPNGAVNPITRNRIARLNPDGTLDTGFDPNANSAIWSVVLQTDGKVLLGGNFTSLQPNGALSATPRWRIARVNEDGTLDTTFDPKANSSVLAVAEQADAKVLLGGWFTTLQPNGSASATSRNRIARVNADGNLDAGFDPNADSAVESIAIQTNGQILLGGFFTALQPNGASSSTARERIARLNADGTLDTAFHLIANSEIMGVTLQADAKALVAGDFGAFDYDFGAPDFIARLHNDPATQSLTAPDTTQVLWSRGGAGPELSQVTFEYGSDGAVGNWTMLGSGERVGSSTSWQIKGLAIPTSGYLRARGRMASGYFNGSSSLIEQVVHYSTFPPGLALRIVDAGNAIYNAGTNTTSIKVDFVTAPSVALNLEYSTNLGTWSAYAGNPTNSGGSGYFSVTFTAPGNQAAIWNNKMFFRGTPP